MKKWTILSSASVKASVDKEDEIIKILLANRGIKTKKQIEEFLNPPNPSKLTPSQVGISLSQLEKAIRRIKKAIKSQEKIIVYGDYDTDGVCATAILWETLHSLGAKVMPYIPTRQEGYGMKIEKIDQFKEEKVGLIITVDHGIVAYPQVEQARKLGIDVIITDHHLLGKKRLKALAIVHTTQLSGAGVSWFLSSRLNNPGLDLVTIGTIADMMILQGANRAIVKHGLDEVRKTKRPGLLALYQVAGLAKEKIGTYEIGFIIGPRLNAAGRMEDPMEALRLVCTKDDQRAGLLASKIDQHNKARQLLTAQSTLHARNLWLTQDGKGKLIFVSHESYEEGVVGLVAGKLVEEFYRPTIIVAKGEKYSRASARSINGFNIVEAIRACADILGPHGGHPLAAGFTIETIKLEELKIRLSQLAESQIDEGKMTPILKIDLELGSLDLASDLLGKLLELEPFGFGNPEPVFLTRGLKVEDARLVGNSSQHLKLRVTCPVSPITLDTIGFGLGEYFTKLTPEEKVDLVYNLVADEWNGNKKIQLKIKDLRLSREEI